MFCTFTQQSQLQHTLHLPQTQQIKTQVSQYEGTLMALQDSRFAVNLVRVGLNPNLNIKSSTLSLDDL